MALSGKEMLALYKKNRMDGQTKERKPFYYWKRIKERDDSDAQRIKNRFGKEVMKKINKGKVNVLSLQNT